MCEEEVHHQRHRTRHVREVTSQVDVPTTLTPAPDHLLRFYFVGCAKEVIKLINLPVVSLFGNRVSGTCTNMITENVNGEPFVTTNRERKLHQCGYIRTDTRSKECLSESSRPGLISVMSPDLPQTTHGLIPAKCYVRVIR